MTTLLTTKQFHIKCGVGYIREPKIRTLVWFCAQKSWQTLYLSVKAHQVISGYRDGLDQMKYVGDDGLDGSLS